MTEENGEIDYGDEEKLYPLADFPPQVTSPVEIGLIENNGEDMDVAEANYIADSINSLMNNGAFVRDENDASKLRNAKFSDFAILLRSTSKNAALYAAQLEERGIPVSLGLDLFYKSQEVQFIMSLLNVVDNPTREVALATVLVSGFFGFTFDDLALIKSADKHKNLYSCILLASQNGNELCTEFLNKIKKYRRKFITMKISEFIDFVYEDLGVLNAVCCLESGEKRKEKLLYVLDFAKTYEEGEGKNVCGFLKFLENVDENRLKSSATETDAVKIMTIHQSKGLQFPVCYFAACSEKFNTKELSSHLLLDEDYYFSFKFFNPESKKRISTIQRQILIQKTHQKQLEESLRLAYVAMTRAQDKLVVLISGDDIKEKINTCAENLNLSNSSIGNAVFTNATCYSDWLLPAVLAHSSSNDVRLVSGAPKLGFESENPFEIKFADAFEVSDTDISVSSVSNALNGNTVIELALQIKENLNYIYPYEEILKIASKASVSQLAHSAEFDAFAFSGKPAYASKGGVSATQKGVITHRVMQFLDFEKAKNNLEEELNRLYEWQFFSERDIQSVDRESVLKFLNSDLCDRIIKSSMVKKEMRFLTERPATEIAENLNSKFAEENVVIQGAVDCLFEENGEIIIVDFKTDRVKDESKLADTYKEQLKIYASACEKIFSKPIKELILYSFHLNKEIKL